MKTILIEARAQEAAEILKTIEALGIVPKIIEEPVPDPAQTVFEWEARRWQCACCLHVLTFACPVTVEDVDACPRCRGKEFRIA